MDKSSGNKMYGFVVLLWNVMVFEFILLDDLYYSVQYNGGIYVQKIFDF